MRVIQSFLGLAIVAVVLYALANHYALGWLAEAKNQMGDPNAWSEEARINDPVGFLNFTQRRLQKQQATLKQTRQNIQQQLPKITEQAQNHYKSLAQNKSLLEDGRGIYRDALAQDTTQKVEAIKWMGRLFDGIPSFKAQLEYLYQEQQNKQVLLEKTQKIQTRMESYLSKVLLHSARVKSALAQIEPMKELVKARASIDALNDSLTSADNVTDSVLNDGQQLEQQYGQGIWTAEELQKSAPNAPSHNKGFEAFLKG